MSGVAVKSPLRIRRAFSMSDLRYSLSCSGVRVVERLRSFSVKYSVSLLAERKVFPVQFVKGHETTSVT